MERLEPGRSRVVFQSKSGPLPVERRDACYVMNFPVRPPRPVAEPDGLADALGARPVEVAHDGFNYVARLEDASQLRRLSPDLSRILALRCDGVIVTAAGTGDYDFLSRYFAPAKGIPEDPVTGGAHCTLAPFWAQRLGKSSLRAFQASRRGGEIHCRLVGDRVELEGRCVFFLAGEAEI
jgi:predicted PhzF superfamily epimerase YddE/YHI9